MERQSGLFLLDLFSWPHFHLFMHKLLFFWLCYIPFAGAYIYLFLYNLRFLCAVFIRWCKLFFVPASFQFVYAYLYNVIIRKIK